MTGKESRRRSLVGGVEEVLAEVLSGMMGPLDVSNMAYDLEIRSLGTEGRQDQRMV